MGKIILTCGLLLTSLAITACNQGEPQKNRFIETPTTIAGMVAVKKADPSFINGGAKTKSRLPQDVTLNENIGGKDYKLVTDNTKIIELSVNGEAVVSGTLGNYKKVTDQMIEDFWTKVRLINSTSKKITEGILTKKDSIDQFKKI